MSKEYKLIFIYLLVTQNNLMNNYLDQEFI